MLALEKKKSKKNQSFPWHFFCRTQKLFYRQMLTFGFVMSFFIIVLNLVFVVPHLILVIQHEYFANKNFENEYYYRKLVSNSPLSKYRLHF